MTGNKVTIKDVAKACGVSTSTVSRVISDDPRISSETKAKVLNSMKELNYYPNAIARSLANNKTNTIALILPSTSEDVFINPFFQEALRGINSVTCQHDYDILLVSSHNKQDELDVIKRLIHGKRVDGIILTRSKINDKHIEYLMSSKMPFVLIGSSLENKSINMVDNDNEKAGYDITQYMIEKGKKRIGLIGGDIQSVVTQNRFKGYLNALKDYNIVHDENLFATGNFERESGYNLTERLLSLENKPDSIIVLDDLIAAGVISKLKEKGYKIPEDIFVASFNNSILSSQSNPPLTSVEINAVKLGKTACNILLELIENELDTRKEIVPHEIVERISTGS